MSNTLQLNKDSIIHCSQNTTEIEGRLFCEKCLGKICNKKKFKTIKSLYHHYLMCHSGSDKNITPTKDECIDRLQGISNALQVGLLK